MASLEIGYVFEWMRANRGLELPYDVIPGHGPGRGYSVFDEARWDAWQWNPPAQYMNDAAGTTVLDWDDPPFSGADAAASEKPTWDAIVSAKLAADHARALADLRIALEEEEERRICAAYGQTSVQGEMFYRLRAARASDTTKLDEQDAERNRLHQVKRYISSILDAEATNLNPDQAALDYVNAIDVSDDNLWAAPPIPLPFNWVFAESGESWVDFGFTPFGATVEAGIPISTVRLR